MDIEQINMVFFLLDFLFIYNVNEKLYFLLLISYIYVVTSGVVYRGMNRFFFPLIVILIEINNIFIHSYGPTLIVIVKGKKTKDGRFLVLF